MPTGYTAPIADGITFEKFAMQCARAMGALIMMRDDPSDAPIPDAFQASDYNDKKVKEARERLEQLHSMSERECRENAQAEHAKDIAYHNEQIAKDAALKVKYEAMLQKVEAWQPPSGDHVNFKNFMRDQITESIRFDCGGRYHEDALAKLKPMTGEEWRKQEVDKATNDIAYHTKEHKEECERTESRNKWVRQLRESLQ